MAPTTAKPTCLVIGGRGFVGSAIVECARETYNVTVVGRDDYEHAVGQHFDLVVNANGNASRFRANQQPLFDLEASVLSVARSLADFRGDHYALISSVDVYHDVTDREATREDAPVDLEALCHYGFHKRMAELTVMRQASSWQIFRLAQMVGKGLRKGPTFDLLNGRPLWVDRQTRLHYMNTSNVARVVLALIDEAPRNEAYNVCGRGTVSLDEVIGMLPESLRDVTFASQERQEYDVNADKVHALIGLPDSAAEVREFLAQFPTPPHEDKQL
ncbi:MAG: NAD-dependent epimerase/dehydratase family protein [Planctomycetota bacterium]|nr:MAG: NAD-dependent epimerase/dehydratase family protein [Planctomycetota bacterium]REJ94597.1 MAG: NAD-dependent epimerase/dehydratase family protein [Planctomycetota bacterium]REK29065.1 MAG: NAD-dependent epimerase/dehydratase family protein [Planctomycetota bacterium]REK46632.1 MAG: NAD-dependent epimerase/dehydratase family protein [Planctomycetota bacterium]